MLRRSSHDRQILALALPALGALAAEPLYVLADTAIVGHLGRAQIAALGLAGTVLTEVFALFNFLTYGTTAVVSRASGAGEHERAGELAAQALWVSAAIGLVLVVAGEALGGPLLDGLGAHGRSGHLALVYFRIAVLGLPAAMIALAGQGFLRGVANLRRPLEIVVAANVANLVLELLFVYGFGWGISGSAAGTAISQAGMGAAFVVELVRAPARSRRPRWSAIRPLVRVGRQIFVRTAALVSAFVVAASVLARVGDAQLGAHQIAFQIFLFLALVLLPLGGLLPRAFTADPAVLHQAALAWPLFALLQPLGGAVFALDGILIGASDTSYLMWSMLAASFLVFLPLALVSLQLGWGIVGVWAALDALLAARLAFLAVRFAGHRWAVVGWN